MNSASYEWGNFPVPQCWVRQKVRPIAKWSRFQRVSLLSSGIDVTHWKYIFSHCEVELFFVVIEKLKLGVSDAIQTYMRIQPIETNWHHDSYRIGETKCDHYAVQMGLTTGRECFECFQFESHATYFSATKVIIFDIIEQEYLSDTVVAVPRAFVSIRCNCDFPGWHLNISYGSQNGIPCDISLLEWYIYLLHMGHNHGNRHAK